MVEPERVRPMSMFYGDIHDRRIHDYLSEGLDDLDAFAQAIATLV